MKKTSIALGAITLVLALSTGCASTVDDSAETGSLNETYSRCLEEHGLPGQAQVFPPVDPNFVKTGVEVPADIHAECSERIGMRVTGKTSWGR